MNGRNGMPKAGSKSETKTTRRGRERTPDRTASANTGWSPRVWGDCVVRVTEPSAELYWRVLSLLSYMHTLPKREMKENDRTRTGTLALLWPIAPAGADGDVNGFH